MADDSDYKQALQQSIDDAKASIKRMKEPDYQRLLEIEEENQDRETMKKWLENNWNSTLKDLNDLVDKFEQQADKALDIQEDKEKLRQRVRELEKEKKELSETVDDLKTTKRKLESGIKKKESAVEELEDELEEEKEENAELKSEEHTLERKVENLKDEKETLEDSLAHTEDLLRKLKHHADEFEEELEV